ncbi:DUF4405 domain-containing protein [Sphingobacterium thalpophilum]|uniref:DUF4405 domain-containing protein n=1 Tax=Sphingobacterium thalpophilum TaxID=259 RepID=UPI0024A7447D|nr:DUF4405 domain-containing protein [Sphingobacterium thalpophilum]
MKLNRNYVTPFISLIFLVVGISGMFMFFHLLDGYTEVVHEIFGLFFFICAIFHILLNWKPLKIHFKKGVFLPAALALAILSVLFIVEQQYSPKVDTIILERLAKAPIADAFRALQVDSLAAVKRLQAKGISVDAGDTLGNLWTDNETNIMEVFDVITEE